MRHHATPPHAGPNHTTPLHRAPHHIALNPSVFSATNKRKSEEKRKTPIEQNGIYVGEKIDTFDRRLSFDHPTIAALSAQVADVVLTSNWPGGGAFAAGSRSKRRDIRGKPKEHVTSLGV